MIRHLRNLLGQLSRRVLYHISGRNFAPKALQFAGDVIRDLAQARQFLADHGELVLKKFDRRFFGGAVSRDRLFKS